MSRLCRLRTKTHGEDGQWAYNEITKQRREIAEYADLCDKLGEALQNCANNEDDVMLTRNALEAWRSMR